MPKKCSFYNLQNDEIQIMMKIILEIDLNFIHI